MTPEEALAVQQKFINNIRAGLNESTYDGLKAFVQETFRWYDMAIVGLEAEYD